MATWHTPASARVFWKDASRLTDVRLQELLWIAREAVIAYAPFLSGTEIPDSWRLAQVMHARNIYNASQGDVGGQVNPETGWSTPSVMPLDWHIRQLLTPTRAFGGIA